MKNKGLGRGLGAILDTEGASLPDGFGAAGRLAEIKLDSIVPNPSQPRTTFDEEALSELAGSIRSLGVIQPVTVRRAGEERYVLVSGERRWRASRMAGLRTVPAYVIEADDKAMQEMALVENVQREDLNPLEVAVALKRLVEEYGVTQDAVAERVGMKRPTVANYLRLLTMLPEVQMAVRNGQIGMGHAKAVAGAPAGRQKSLLKRVLSDGLSVRRTEELARRTGHSETAAPHMDEELPESYTRLTERLAAVMGDDIRFRRNPDGGGRIIIGFTDDSQIDRLLALFEHLTHPE